MRNTSEAHPTVLLTGFGPFPGVSINASAGLVRRVARLARRRFPEFRFVVAILSTEWVRAPHRIEGLYRRYRPLLALHFGVASGTHRIRLETEAGNFCRHSRDAAGMFPPSPVLCAGGPAKRCATIDIPAIADALNAGGWPCSISHDAGGYLCNAVFYHSLALAERLGNCRGGFVHVPADLSKPPLRLDETAAAALKIIEITLEPMRGKACSELSA